MAGNREQQARYRAMRKLVLARLKEEEPDLFDRWWLDARDVLAAQEAAARRSAAARRGHETRRRRGTVLDDPPAEVAG